MSKIFRKPVITLLLVLVIALCGLCAFQFSSNNRVAFAAEDIETSEVASGTCGTSLTWALDSNGELHITGEGVMTTYSYGQAPWYSYVKQIKSIIVDDTVTKISLGAFYGCNSLKEISLPFIGNSRTATAYSATFGYIFGYSTISVTARNDYWNRYTFNIYGISNGVSYSSYTGSVGEKENSSTTFVNSQLSNPTGDNQGVWQYSCYDSRGEVYHELSSGWEYEYVYFLRSYYYFIPESLTKVTVTDATAIVAAAFNGCSNLTEINLNDSITSIGTHAFKNCTSLDVFALPNQLIDLGEYAFYNCDALTDIVIPNGVKTIQAYTFYDCDELVHIDFNDAITEIGNYAFKSCDKLSITLFPIELQIIGSHSFEECNLLSKIIIPNKVTKIDQ